MKPRSAVPAGKKVIPGRWILTVKKLPDGTIERFKARYVCQGFRQKEGEDFYETFSPTLKFKTLRTLFAIAAMRDMTLRQLDVKTAYLNGSIEPGIEIYIKHPPGIPMPGDGSPDQVCHLNKALYGLKQAGLVWYQNFDTFMVAEQHYTRSEADGCLYIKYLEATKEYIYLTVYVDDLVICSKDDAEIEALVRALNAKYSMKDMGELRWLLGMEVIRDRAKSTITLSQRSYASEVLKRYKMDECKAVSTPAEPGTMLSKDMCPTTIEEISEMQDTPYSSAVGSIMYAMTGTRPDLAFALGQCCRYISNPGKEHWMAVKRVLRYLKGTLSAGLQYGKSEALTLEAYSDAGWGGPTGTGKSVGGWLILINGSPVSWSSKLQPIVTLSSTEAELVAVTEAAKEAVWFRTLLGELGFPQDSPTTVWEDNQSCMALAKNRNVHHPRQKHLHIRHFWVRDAILMGTIVLRWCSTHDQKADIMTKATPRPVMAKHIDTIMSM
jgi:hypothetical protein